MNSTELRVVALDLAARIAEAQSRVWAPATPAEQDVLTNQTIARAKSFETYLVGRART